MKTPFIKGPYRLRIAPPTAIIPGHIIEAQDAAQTPICIVQESESNWRAGGTPRRVSTARLFMAAPELFAALEATLPILDDAEQDAREKALNALTDHRSPQKKRQEFNAKWLAVADAFKAQADEARAVLAKVIGKQSAKRHPQGKLRWSAVN